MPETTETEYINETPKNLETEQGNVTEGHPEQTRGPSGCSCCPNCPNCGCGECSCCQK